jgi:hypothetical protein
VDAILGSLVQKSLALGPRHFAQSDRNLELVCSRPLVGMAMGLAREMASDMERGCGESLAGTRAPH